MTIVVNPHTKEEELALLTFLNQLHYDYSTEEQDSSILSDAQKKEIVERDNEYESGNAETFTLREVMAQFNIKE